MSAYALTRQLDFASIVVDGEHIKLRCSFSLLDNAKAVPGHKWIPHAKSWVYPATPEVAAAIGQQFNGDYVKFDAKFGALLKRAGEIERGRNLSKSKPNELPEPPSKTKAWDHQKRAFHFAKSMPGAMLAMEMGCGKSKVAVDLCCANDRKVVLVCCPLSVTKVWTREFQTHGIHPYECTVLTGDITAKRAEKMLFHIGVAQAKHLRAVVIVNHEAVWRGDFAKALLGAGIDQVIVDESHRAKDPSGRLSTFLWQYRKRVPNVLMLSGTPMPHSEQDIFAQYRALDPGVFGDNYFKFRLHFFKMGGFKNKQVIGLKEERADEFKAKVARLMFRVTKAEALDLPDEIYSTVECDMPDEARKIYDQMFEDFYTKVEHGEITASNALVQLLKLQQITSGFASDDQKNIRWVGDHKRDLLASCLGDTPAGHRAVVFCRFTRDLETVRDVAGKLGRVYGEISGKQKDLTTDAKMPPHIDVMGVQIQAGGVGIDLTAADYAFYYSAGFSFGDYDQSRSRLHRPGQRNPVTYTNLVVRNTIDARVFAALAKREDAVNSILNNLPEIKQEWRDGV